MSDPGKGTVTRPPNDGTLIQDSYPFDPSVVRGDTAAFGDAGSKTGFDVGAPVWLEGFSVDKDATNSMGAVGGTDSDPMFDMFKHQATGNEDQANQAGSNSPEGVSSSSMPSPSDPMGQEMPKGDGVTPSSADKEDARYTA